jgi:hypothetical protein
MSWFIPLFSLVETLLSLLKTPHLSCNKKTTGNHWAAQTAFLTDLDVRTIHGTHLRLGHG